MRYEGLKDLLDLGRFVSRGRTAGLTLDDIGAEFSTQPAARPERRAATPSMPPSGRWNPWTGTTGSGHWAGWRSDALRPPRLRLGGGAGGARGRRRGPGPRGLRGTRGHAPRPRRQAASHVARRIAGAGGVRPRNAGAGRGLGDAPPVRGSAWTGACSPFCAKPSRPAGRSSSATSPNRRDDGAGSRFGPSACSTGTARTWWGGPSGPRSHGCGVSRT